MIEAGVSVGGGDSYDSDIRESSSEAGPERLVPSPDGRYLAFAVDSSTQELWIIEGF